MHKSHGEGGQQWCYPSTEQPCRDLVDSYFHVCKTISLTVGSQISLYMWWPHCNCLEWRARSSFSKHVLSKNCSTSSNCCKPTNFHRLNFRCLGINCEIREIYIPWKFQHIRYMCYSMCIHVVCVSVCVCLCVCMAWILHSLCLIYIQVGDAKDPVRKGVRVLFGQLCCIYPPSKLFPYLVDGLKSKNSRQRSGTR